MLHKVPKDVLSLHYILVEICRTTIVLPLNLG